MMFCSIPSGERKPDIVYVWYTYHLDKFMPMLMSCAVEFIRCSTATAGWTDLPQPKPGRISSRVAVRSWSNADLVIY